MLDRHEGFAREAAAHGADVMCFQELFYGPYFGITQEKKYYRLAEPVEGPPERIAADAVRRAPLAFDDLVRSLASAHPVAAGSAAAAAGFGPVHHGNDIGGSLRFPSFNCGLATVKPTFGRVPAWLPSAPAERGILSQMMSVQGAICREVRDVRLATRVMAREDARDPFWMPVPFEGWPKEKPVRVGVAKETYGHPIHPDIATSIDHAAGFLSDAGYAVEPVTIPPVDDAAQCWFRYLGHELKVFLMPLARQHGSRTIQQIFEWYFEMGEVGDAEDYRTGIKERTAMTREWNVFLEHCPLVLSPFYLQPTPDWDCDSQSLEGAKEAFNAAIYSTGINWVSLPAGVVPIGMVEDRPAGVQLIGRRFREDLILDAMEAIEKRVGVLTRELWARENQ